MALERLPDRTHQVQMREVTREGQVVRKPFQCHPQLRALGPVASGYQFFSPAILYLYLDLPDRILLDFGELVRSRVEFLVGQFRKPIFQGLDRPGTDDFWNHVLWGIANEQWDAFKDFMCSLLLRRVNPPGTWCVTYQDLVILDPAFRDRDSLVTSEVSTLKIGVFQLLSHDKFIYLAYRPGHTFLDVPVSFYTHTTQQMRDLHAVLLSRPVSEEVLKPVEQFHHGQAGDT